MNKVLVIGDSCVDVFEYGNCQRICPEAPVPVLIPTDTKSNSGMASNVYENLRALGVDCDIITNDIKPIKTRFIDETSNHMIVRVDRDDKVDPIDWNTLKNIDFPSYDIVVISDYNKGFLNTEKIQYISRSHYVTVMDTKKHMGEWCNGIQCIKINEKEYQNNWEYLNHTFINTVIVTRGKDDTVLNWHQKEYQKFFPIKNEHPVRDLTGAGDTFLAGLVANYIESKDIGEAIKFANRCAAWAVTQKGVAVVSMDKLKNNGYCK